MVLGEPQNKEYSYSKITTSPKAKSYKYSLKKSDKGYLGIFMQDLNDQLADYFEVDEGVLITKVEEDTPAEEAGLKAGDVIVAIDGEEIGSSNDAGEIIADHEKGDKVDIAVIRKGVKKNFAAVLDEREMDLSWYGLSSDDNNVLKFYSGEDFTVPNIEFDFDPADMEFELKGLNDDLEQEMKALKQELQDLKKELNDLKHELK